jgi:hypothetical protein
VCYRGWWHGVIIYDFDVSCPSIVDNANLPEAMSGVTPPPKDDFTVKCDFAAGGIEEYFPTGIAEDWNG